MKNLNSTKNRFALCLFLSISSAFLLSELQLNLSLARSAALAQTTSERSESILLQVEGVLKEGDATLTDDSFYDEYVIRGRAGEKISITLESLAFDTYLLLVDEAGEKLAENDDIPSEIIEVTRNSWITVTLPGDGEYRVIVNSSREWGWGDYKLTVTAGDTGPILSDVALRQSEANRSFEQGIQEFRVSQFRNALKSWQLALDIYREVNDRVGESTSLGHLGIVYRNLGQYQEAISLFEQSLAITLEIGDRAGEGRTLGNWGITYLYLGQYQQAIDLFEQSLVIIREIGDRAGEGRVLGNLGIVYDKLGQYREAIDFYEQAGLIARETGNRIGEGQNFGNLGNVSLNLGQYQQAIDFYHQQLTITREISDRRGESNALGNLGIVYRILGQYQQAIDLFEQRLSIVREIGDRAGEGQTLGNLGSAYSNLGQYQQAINLYEQSLSVAYEIGDRAGASQNLGNLGTVYRVLGQYQQSINLFQQQLAINHEIGDRAGVGTGLSNLGIVYRRLEQYQQAIDLHEQSLAIAREIGNHAGEGIALGNLGIIYDNLGQYQQAIDLYEQGLVIARETENHAGEGRVLANLGIVYDNLGQYSDAINHLQQALAIYQKIEATVDLEQGVTFERGNILTALGQTYEAQEKTELAIVFLKESVNVWETIRTGLQNIPPEELLSYTDTVADNYRLLAELLLQQGRIMEALQVLDLLKVQELQDFFKDVDGNERTSQGIEFLQEEQQFWDALEIEQLEQYTQSPSTTALMEQLRQTAPAQNLTLNAYTDLQTRLQNLGTNSALFYPLILEDSIELVLFTRNAPPVNYSIPVSQTELETAVQSFRADLEDPNSQNIEASAQQLYDWLVKPIEADLQQANIETIIYAPDGQMRYVPLAALHDGQQWLTEKYQVNYITALSLTDIEPEVLDNPQILAGAFSEDSADVSIGAKTFSFGSIPFAETEVETLASIFPNTTKLLDTAFNRDAVASDRMNAHNIVHFATHGKLVSGNPEESFILLNNGEYVTLREIRDWDLPNVALVVLSACQTALGDRLSNGIEVIGFGYQLQQAQARASISTLWEISDVGTNNLMDVFYGLLRQGDMTQVEALRQAQIALITGNVDVIDDGSRAATGIRVRFEEGDGGDRQLGHPYYWAPFILIGNGL